MCLLSKLLLGRLSHSLLGQLFKLGNFLNDLNWLEGEIPLVMCLLFCVTNIKQTITLILRSRLTSKVPSSNTSQRWWNPMWLCSAEGRQQAGCPGVSAQGSSPRWSGRKTGCCCIAGVLPAATLWFSPGSFDTSGVLGAAQLSQLKTNLLELWNMETPVLKIDSFDLSQGLIILMVSILICSWE